VIRGFLGVDDREGVLCFVGFFVCGGDYGRFMGNFVDGRGGVGWEGGKRF